MDIKLVLLFFFITAIITLSYLADKNVDRIFRIKAPAANKVPPHVHPKKKVYADVNEFTCGKAAIAYGWISGQFRSRLNTARCTLNLVVRKLR